MKIRELFSSKRVVETLKKKKATTLVVMAAICMLPMMGAAASGYSDVKSSDWYYPSVTAMSAAGIISGNPDGSFKPEDTVTYGDFITMATKVATGKDLPAAEEGHWAKNYYDLAVEEKIIDKSEVFESTLDVPITREYMAVIASNILGDSVDVSGEFYTLLQGAVSDVEATTPHEYEIIRSYGAGILSGYPDGTFQPQQTLQRAEAASVIWHLADKDQRKAPTMEELKKKQEQQAANRSQEDRIQDILDNGPQKISFSPGTDETKDRDGRTVMKEDKAREYMDQILASLKFYGDKGKYYMTVTLPEVPDGYQVHLGTSIAYKQSLMKPRWVADSIWTSAQGSDAEIKKTGTSIIEIKGLTSLSQLYTVHIGMSINHKDDTDLGSQEASYAVHRAYDGAIEDSVGINRQGSATLTDLVIPYTLDRHFQWK